MFTRRPCGPEEQKFLLGAPLVSFLPDLITNIVRHSLTDTKLTNSGEIRYEIHDFVILHLTIFRSPPNKDISK
jgi:hypothetical protein